MERKVWLASEEVRCSGVMVVPDDHQPGERRAALVLCGGYGAVKQMVLPEMARHLARAGYVTLAIDYRCFGESEGEPRSQLLPAGQVEDVRNAISFLQQQPEVDPDRIALWGVQIGGGVALHAAAADRRVRCVVAQSPVVDGRRWMRGLRSPSRWEQLLDRLQRDRLSRGRSGYSEYVTAIAADGFCAMPGDDQAAAWIDACYAATPTLRRQITLRSVEALVEWRPEALLPEIAPRPACIVALERDTVVPPEEAARAFARLGEPRRLVWLSQGDARHHTQLLSGPGLAAAAAAAIDFLSQHLPALPRAIAEAAAAAEPAAGESAAEAEPEPQPQAEAGHAQDGAQAEAPGDDAAQPQPEPESAGAAGESAAAAEPAAGESAAAAEPEPQPQAEAGDAQDGAQAEAPGDDAAQPQPESAGAAGESAAAAEPEPQPQAEAGDAQDGAQAEAPGDDSAQPQPESAGAAGESAAAAEPEPHREAWTAHDETAAASELRDTGGSDAAGGPETQPQEGTAAWRDEIPAATPELGATLETAAASEHDPVADGQPPAGAAPGTGPDESAATAERMPMTDAPGGAMESGMDAMDAIEVGDAGAGGEPAAGEAEAGPEPGMAAEPTAGPGVEASEPPLAAASEPQSQTATETPQGSGDDAGGGTAAPRPWQPPAETRPWWDRPLNTSD